MSKYGLRFLILNDVKTSLLEYTKKNGFRPICQEFFRLEIKPRLETARSIGRFCVSRCSQKDMNLKPCLVQFDYG